MHKIHVGGMGYPPKVNHSNHITSDHRVTNFGTGLWTGLV